MKHILFTILSAFILVSCSDSFLDKSPLDELSEEDVYSNASLMEAYVNSFYTVLPDPFTEGNISSITDESFFRYGGTSTNYIARGLMTPDNIMYISEGGYAHNTRTTYLNIWNRAYSYIRNMNEFLTKLNSSTVVTDAQKKQYRGETLFCRAWAYTNLIERWGGVPYITKVFDMNESFGVARNNFDDCVDSILVDLKEAEGLLDPKPTVLGRPGKDACLALESRLTLIAASPLFNDPSDPTGSIFKGTYSKDKWTRALNAAKAICDRADNEGAYSLGTYDDFWTNTASKEVIWGKFFSPTSGNKAQLFYTPTYFSGWTSCEPTEALVLDYEMAATGKKIFEDGSGYDPAHPWAGRDPRFYKTIIYPDCVFRDSVINNHYYVNENGSKKLKVGKFWYSDANDTGYGLRKWHIESASVSESENTTLMFPWFRLAEMYLNYAECLYETGDEAGCRKYLNKVRSRTGVAMPDIPETDTGASLFDRIVNERRVELAFEPFRYFDLRRWKLADFYENVLMSGTGVLEFPDGTLEYRVPQVYGTGNTNSYKAGPWQYKSSKSHNYLVTYTYRGKSYQIDYGKCHDMMGTQKAFHADRNYLLPIPTNEITKSEGSIVQNPNY